MSAERIPHRRRADDRLDRMAADPEAYFAEAKARARELVERDVERERQLRRERRKRRVWCLLAHRWFMPTVYQPCAGRDTYLCRRCGETWGRP